MKKISLQWRITLMTALLIGVTCIAMNLLLCSSGIYYMDTIADTLQGGDRILLDEEDTVSFDPQLAAPDGELTILIDGAQGRFRTTNWYITAVVTALSGILAYFVSGHALKPLRSWKQMRRGLAVYGLVLHQWKTVWKKYTDSWNFRKM